MSNAIKINELPLETLKEMMNEAAELVQKHARNAVAKAIDCGRYLAAARQQIGHGGWTVWLGANFNYTERHAQRFMQIAGYAETHSLEQAESIQHALRIIADDPATPKRDKKEPVPSVKVVEPERSAESAKSSDAGEPPELPKTNTKYTAENRKANPAEQPATRPVNVQAELVEAGDGNELLGKAEQFDIAPELITAVEKTRDGRPLIDVLGEEDPQQLIESCFKHNAVTAIVRFLINSTKDKDVEDVAKQLRKAADLLDPPKKPAKAGAVPRAADLIEAISPDWPDDLFEATKQWATYKQGRAKGERIQSMSAWEIARKQIWSKAEANGVDAVVQKIEKAIANSWKGWDHGDKDDAKKTATGRTGRIKPTSAVPPIEYR